MQFSLLENNKNRFLQLLQEINNKSPSPKGYMLILDQNSTKIISAHFKLSQLLDQNILSIEKLELARKPFQKMQAIYFISPSSESIQILLDDFKDKENKKYKYAHIIFTNQINEQDLQDISKSSMVPYIKSLKEFNLDYQVRDDNCFSLLMQDFIIDYTNQDFKQSQIASQKLFTIIPSLQKYYEFEIIYNQNDFNISKNIAEQLKIRIDSHLKYLQDSESEIFDKQSGRISILILDRSVDILSAIIHDFHYQPLLYDIQNVQNDTIEIQEKQKTKNINISQNALFQKYKYEHIADALQGIPKDMQKYMNENNAAKLQKGEIKNVDIKDMNSIITQMPQYQETINGFQINITQMEKCLKAIEQQDLKAITDLEFCLSTGIDQKAQSIKEKDIFDKLLLKLQSENVLQNLKKRLIIVAILSLQLNDENRKKLTDFLDTNEQKSIQNLVYLGVNLQQQNAKLQLKVDEYMKKQVKELANNTTLELNRYIPYTQQIIEKVGDSLQQKKYFEGDKNLKTQFQSIYINKSQQVVQQKKGGLIGKLINTDEKAKESQNKLIVFVAGGISYLEIKAIRQQTKKMDIQIIIGGSNVQTQQDFVDQLQNLKK